LGAATTLTREYSARLSGNTDELIGYEKRGHA